MEEETERDTTRAEANGATHQDGKVSRRQLLISAGAAGGAAIGAAFLAEAAPGGGGRVPQARAQGAAAPGSATPVPLGPSIPDEFTTRTNWPYEGLDLQATRNVQGTTISEATVGQLGEAWTAPIKASAAFGALTANPIVVGDTVYIQDASANVYAFDKNTGQARWHVTYNDTVPSGGPNGLAGAYGMIFTTVGGAGDVVALQPDSGKEVWRTTIRGPLLEGITTAPLVYGGVVYVSTIPGSSDGFYLPGQRGVIHALDARSGHVLWYFDTTTDNLWGNPRVNSGGGFWHPPSVDQDGNLYVGIGNPAPWPGTADWPNGLSRPGANLYTDCILKLDPTTGVLDWYYQVVPHDLFDRDNQLTPIVADLNGRPVVFTSGKHGFAVCLDRTTGDVLWRVPVGEHKNDDITEIPAGQSVFIMPNASVETPMAYADGKLFLPLWALGLWLTPQGIDPKHPLDLTGATGSLVALNAADGNLAWQVKPPTSVLGGATVTNDLVFTAGLDGLIRGYRTADGKEVFRYQATAGINTSPAVSGDTMYWAAGAPLIASPDTAKPAPKTAAQVVALKLGGKVQATPVS